MHTALNAPNTHSSNDSAHGPSSLLYSSIQPLNIKMFQPITPSEKSISEFYTQYKPGQTPSKDDIEVSSKVTPSHKATTNESYSIDKYYYPDNSEYLSKQSYVNSSVPSQPLTAKDSQKDITFNKELLDNMAVIEYEEFVLDGNLESIRKRPTPKQKSVPEISFTPHQEQLINIKVVQQTPEENVNILSKEKKVEYRRNDRREGSKVLSDTPSKDILDRKELTSTGKTGRSNRGSYDVDDSHLKRFIKGIKEHGEFSTENSDLSPDHMNGYGLLFKEVEVLRNILREKETLLGADKEAKAISSELIKRNEELIIENTTLKCDMVKLTETLKQREGELMHLSDKNQHQRELMIKLEEKYALMERVNMNHEKDRKSQDEQISLLKEENKLLKENTEKYKENIELLQGSYSQLKDNFESVTQTLAHQKSEASNHNDTVNLYKLKVSRANDALKEQKEITASKEGIITNLLERLDEFARQIACKDAEIANLKGEIATMNEDVIHVKGDKVKLRTKSQADCNNVKQSFNMTDRTKLQLLIAQNKEHQSLTTRSILDFTRGHRGSQDSYSESVNYMTSVMEDERKTFDHPSTMTEGKRKKSGTHADEEQKLDRSSKNIKVTTSSGTKGKEKKVYHLHIGKEHRNYDGYETRRGGDVDVIDLALRSARGNSKGSAEKIKTLVVVQSPPAQIKPLNFTNTQRSLIEGSQTKRKCETYRPSAPTKPTEKERQTSKPVEGTKGHKRYPSQSSDDDKNGNKSARSTRNNSKRPSNVDNDYYDPYSIGVGTSKNSQLQTPLAVTSINFDSRREMLSAKSTRSQMFKVSEQTPKADKSPVQRKVKGVLIPGLEMSKSLADAVIKNERAVKSARKK